MIATKDVAERGESSDIQHPMSQQRPELRTDWLTGRTVLLAENRALRPNDFVSDSASGAAASTDPQKDSTRAGCSEAAQVSSCPFCVGNEWKTPPALYEKRDGNNRWKVRVVPNMYPALMMESPGEVVPVGSSESHNSGARSVLPALGAHEVIIESPRHIDRMATLTETDLGDVLETYAQRLRHWRDSGRFAYALVFKNQGGRAGASIAHVHSQFVALPTVPWCVEAELQRAADEFRKRRFCPYCRWIEQERSFERRVVFEREGYLAFCPSASLQPHEVWLLPLGHQSSFEQAAPDARRRLAGVLHVLLRRLEACIPHAAYNLLLRTAPFSASCDAWYHWRIELLPRVNAIAGFEIATGIHINSFAPERAAVQLREG